MTMIEYFSHDFKARHDKKLVSLAIKHKMTGIGIYWCLVEMLHEEGGYLMLSECERIAYELREDINIINDIINNFDLFKIDNGIFYSESVIIRINERKTRSKKASESANARWNKANVMRTQCECNAIKEKKRKVKEKKEIIISEQIFKFNEWLKINAPRVLEMQIQFNDENLTTAKSKFTTTEIQSTLKAMHNYKPLLQKNTDAYLTMTNWINRDREKKKENKI